jgi:hypothetical protein
MKMKITLSFLLFIIALFMTHDCYPEKKIHPHGYWCGKEDDIADEHKFDPSLAKALADFFLHEKVKTVVDFGCGRGDYVKTFLKHRLKCEGLNSFLENYLNLFNNIQYG